VCGEVVGKSGGEGVKGKERKGKKGGRDVTVANQKAANQKAGSIN
jgi:hypothetical protein